MIKKNCFLFSFVLHFNICINFIPCQTSNQSERFSFDKEIIKGLNINDFVTSIENVHDFTKSRLGYTSLTETTQNKLGQPLQDSEMEQTAVNVSKSLSIEY